MAAPLLQLLSLFALLSLCYSESKGGPRVSVRICDSDNKGLVPTKEHGPDPKLDEKEYNITITLMRLSDGEIVDCVEDNARNYIVRISAAKFFKGFVITSTTPGTGYVANFVGKFAKIRSYNTDENLVDICDNTISHSDVLKRNPVYLRWKSSPSGREVEFLYTVLFEQSEWIANLTTRFPVCTKQQQQVPKCISRVVEPDSSGSVSANKATTDFPGSALPSENKCQLAKKKLETDLTLPFGDHIAKYLCIGHVMECKENCTYCDQGCESVRSKMVFPMYMCTLTEHIPGILHHTLPIRGKKLVREDEECTSQVVEPDSSGSGSGSSSSNKTTTDFPGSALPSENKCQLAKKKLETYLTLPFGDHIAKYLCTGHVMECKGNCTYCDQGCESVRSKMVFPKYMCTLTEHIPGILHHTLPSRGKKLVREDEECKCMGKYDDSNS